ncbi:MAG: 50S ribosomal protein L35 [Candidatus Paceibacterota bacterium]
MANKSIKDRIKITKTGKVLRRAMGLAHFKTTKSKKQLNRKKKKRGLDIDISIVKDLLNQ